MQIFRRFGDVPKRLKGSDSKSDRPSNRRGGSNPSISVMENVLVENALYILVLIGTAFTFVWLWSFREVLDLSASYILVITAAYTIMDAVCVKLFAVLEHWDLSAVTGMSLFGAVFFMPGVIWALAKICHVKPGLLFDISTPGFIFMFMCGRINCLICGCCYGTYLTDTLRWPVREGEIALYVILLIIFCVRLKKKQFTGTYYPVFLISYGIFRFAAEFVRYYEDQPYLWHRGHLCALIALAAGIISFILVKHYRKLHLVPPKKVLAAGE